MGDDPGKFNFDHIYDLDDPREYFRTLGEFEYRIPDHGRRIFSALVEAKREGGRPESVRVLDLCCSYGVNAALLKCEVDLDDLYERYCSEEVSRLSSDELVESDVAYFRERAKESPPRVAGLDVARNAVRYALEAGILDAGFAEDLEEAEPSDRLKQAAARADLLTITGGTSYITERTFGRLISAGAAAGRVPWVAAFVLRTVSYAPVSEVFSGYGMVTEKLHGHTFDQRRFASAQEREFALQEVASLSLNPEGKEENGRYHNEFYLSRPTDEADEPVEELLAPVLEAPESPGRA